MRLSHLKIVNHSRIADLDLAIRRHAVIVGANDVGKSSVLRLLHLLLGASAASLYQQLGASDLRDGADEMTVEATLIEFNDHDRALFYAEIDVDADDSSESMLVRLTVAPDPDDQEAVDIRRWFPHAGHSRSLSRDQIQAIGWRYLPATRSAAANQVDGPNSALATLLHAIELGVERDELAELLAGFNDKLAASDAIADMRDKAASHLSRAMPQAVVQEDLAVRTAADPAEDVLAGVSMFLKRGDSHVPMTELSDGLRQLVSMTLFDLAEGAANIVAIDEPELHLHPSSQRTVAGLFGTASNQKVLVTHSPFIVQRFEPADIVAVNRDGQAHQVPDEKLNVVDKQRVNWWSPRLLEVLTARYAIVVEGLTDRLIVERAAELADIALDRIGAVVFEIDGADKFPHVYRILGANGFNVPLLGLVDDKEKGSWVNAFGEKPKNVFGSKLWVSEPDLEHEVCAAFGGPAAAQALVDGGFCRSDSILKSAGVEDQADVTVEAAANYARTGKTPAAVALASQLDAATAAKIASINGLLTRLVALDAK